MTAGLLSFIPYVGSLTGLLLSVGVAIVQFWPDWTWIVATLGVFVVGQFVEGNILSPKLVGASVGLHPVWLMFALLAFGSLFGFVGLLLAVPLAAAVGVLARFALRALPREPALPRRQAGRRPAAEPRRPMREAPEAARLRPAARPALRPRGLPRQPVERARLRASSSAGPTGRTPCSLLHGPAGQRQEPSRLDLGQRPPMPGRSTPSRSRTTASRTSSRTAPWSIEDADRAGARRGGPVPPPQPRPRAAGLRAPDLRARRPTRWGLRTPDLLSRLRLAPSVSLDAPDDALLKAVLVKLFVDRQLVVDTSVVDYIALRIERSLARAAEIVAALDREALSRGRRDHPRRWRPSPWRPHGGGRDRVKQAIIESVVKASRNPCAARAAPSGTGGSDV